MSKTNLKQRLEHALHNEKACLLLHGSSEAFPDWVITTAFYAALHFVQYKAFPLKEDEEEFESFDDYYAYVSDISDYSPSKHKCTINIVNRHFPSDVAAAYRLLFEKSNLARYNDYNLGEKDVEEAMDALAKVKKYCNTGKPSDKETKPKRKRMRLPLKTKGGRKSQRVRIPTDKKGR